MSVSTVTIHSREHCGSRKGLKDSLDGTDGINVVLCLDIGFSVIQTESGISTFPITIGESHAEDEGSISLLSRI